MSVKRKIREEKKKKDIIHVPPGKQPPPMVVVVELADAVVDGRLTVDVGREIVVVQEKDGKIVSSICTIMKIEDGLVSSWDETYSYWYCFRPDKLSDRVVTIKRFP